MNKNNSFKRWYDNIGDVQRAGVSMLDDVISVCDGTNNVTTDEIL